MNSYKFTIITPTFLRESIERLFKSIDSQTYSNWQHIVLIDSKPTDEEFELLSKYRQLNRLFILYKPGELSGWPGSEMRHFAWDYALGDYLLYIDDDDWYEIQALEILNRYIDTELWGIFPVTRLGQRFFHPDNISAGLISGIQFFHRKEWNGQQIKWPKENLGMDDWKFIEELQKASNPLIIDISESLAYIDNLGAGKK